MSIRVRYRGQLKVVTAPHLKAGCFGTQRIADPFPITVLWATRMLFTIGLIITRYGSDLWSNQNFVTLSVIPRQLVKMFTKWV